ncbi:glycosyltransferase [Synechococcus sp. CBW1006]|uniref:glycosyltransferase n=1 Tax=Synechococcus sp. CBW1006 TaxID=1353138 RepID=UPI0018CE0444|nr:glycosyltransferase [Synechococcus sp. CBW1006]QPN65920.1 glycosyltransferase [Synechococcus sp. CBW1006]
MVLWRHQQLFRCGSITSADPQLGRKPGLGMRVWNLLRRLRLGRVGLILQPWLWQRDLSFSAGELCLLRQQADAILTVAHGLGWLQAMAAANATGLPLITVVHDWYPDASGCPRWGLWIWERSFRWLMRSSALVFAVSEGMARQIGPHPNLQVLPPIPDPALQPSPPRQPHSGPWQLYYSGLCGGFYKPLLQQLIDAVAADPRFGLHLSGPGSEGLRWSDGNSRLRRSGFLHGPAWQQAFDEADALVLVLSFERRHRRHLATHFPSKLVEYANRGRPILIWGPPWSSAVQWAIDQSGVLCHTTHLAPQFLEAADVSLQLLDVDTPMASGLSAEYISALFNETLHFMMVDHARLIPQGHPSP